MCAIKCGAETTKPCISLFAIISYIKHKSIDVKSKTILKYDINIELCKNHVVDNGNSYHLLIANTRRTFANI